MNVKHKKISKKRGYHSSHPPKRHLLNQIHLIILVSLSIIFFFSFLNVTTPVGQAAQQTQVSDSEVCWEDNGDKICAVLDDKKISFKADLTNPTNAIYFESEPVNCDLGQLPQQSIINYEGILQVEDSFFSVTCDDKLLFGDASLTKQVSGEFKIVEFIVDLQEPSANVVLEKLNVFHATQGYDLFPDDPYLFDLSQEPCNVGEQKACGSNAGVCQEGVKTCQQDGFFGECVGQIEPGIEICNQIDDDCDGTVDNGVCQDIICPENDCPVDKICQEGICQDTTTPTPPPTGGRKCLSNWECETAWSYCNSSLEQSRNCLDTKRCNYKNYLREETRSCSQCVQSWVCSEWSSCSNNFQTRTCVDEHKCGSTTRKPVLQKSCTKPAPLPEPNKISPQLPTYTQPVDLQQPTVLKNIWNQHKVYLVVGSSSLLLLIIVILIIIHIVKPKGAQNIDQLTDWIKQEKSHGSSESEIRATLSKHTDWKKNEIDEAFRK